jgi:hypothetical protein
MPEPALQELIEASNRIIPKLAIAANGEQKDHFLATLAVFARTCCEKWNVPIEKFIEWLPPPPRTAS